MKKERAFTLIELLVVIAIIGLLSSIVMNSLSVARAKSRDARRINDLAQIRTALELYRNDYGYYPQSPCGWDCNNYYYSHNANWQTGLGTVLAPYIVELPIDPINTNGCGPWTLASECYSYAYGNVGRTTYSENQYDLTARLEDTNHPQRCGYRGYRFYFDDRRWCQAFGGAYSNQIYEASLNANI